MDYFRQLLDLLKTEREADQAAYQEQTAATSIQERKANGLTWYPVVIRDTEMSRGDYLTVELERPTNQDIPHQFRFGAAAALFSNHDPKNDRIAGTVSWQGENRLKLSLRTDELPDWARDGKLGIDLLFDDNSYDEMQQALKQASALAEKKTEGRLIRILTGGEKPRFDERFQPAAISELNVRQQEAVNKILSAEDLAIVHGPPGTGKTTTLVQAIRALIRRNGKQVLVAAPSNTAVDLLSEKLSELGLNVLRVGNPARVSEKLSSLTLDSKMSEHTSMKEIKRLKKQANEFRNMAQKYKRNFGKAEWEQRKALFREARNILKEVEKTEEYILSDLFGKAQVIAATLVGANHYTVRHLRYETVVIDEAGQAMEPACWIPILKGRKLVLAGDHFQLSPTIKSDVAARNGLATTLLEKAVHLHPETVVLLEEQYRMHERIMGYSSAVFYQQKLKAHHTVAEHILFPGDEPLDFVDTAGCGFDEKQEGTSTSNPEEAAFLLKHLNQYVDGLKQYYDSGNFPTIAIISPYKQQILQLKEQLAHHSGLQELGGKISINTIDSFQGQERDIVYISMTRSNPDNSIGFLSEVRRMNVAMTRARKKLVVIGDSATLSQHDFYAGFIDYTQAQNSYRSAWDFMDI